jgi:SAM-dependent methyltransferase
VFEFLKETRRPTSRLEGRLEGCHGWCNQKEVRSGVQNRGSFNVTVRQLVLPAFPDRHFRCSDRLLDAMLSRLDRRTLKARVSDLPLVGPAAKAARDYVARRHFTGSASYWEHRYAAGGNSGAGSYGRLAQAKADVLNKLVTDERIGSVLEIGCGDGSQVALARYPSYVGVDVAPSVVAACRMRFAADSTKSFLNSGDHLPACELGLSLDVIYHLVEDEVFERYMIDLLGHSSRLVVLYTSDSEVFVPPGITPPHIRHRPVGRWMSTQIGWRFRERIANPYPFQIEAEEETSFADFYVFEKTTE